MNLVIFLYNFSIRHKKTIFFHVRSIIIKTFKKKNLLFIFTKCNKRNENIPPRKKKIEKIFRISRLLMRMSNPKFSLCHRSEETKKKTLTEF